MSRKFPGLPRTEHVTGVQIDREYETYVPRSQVEGLAEALEEAEEFLERVTEWKGSDEDECWDTLFSVRKALTAYKGDQDA